MISKPPLTDPIPIKYTRKPPLLSRQRHDVLTALPERIAARLEPRALVALGQELRRGRLAALDRVERADQVEVDLLRHDRVELVRRVCADKAPHPRRGRDERAWRRG